jgi:hypothetical protein
MTSSESAIHLYLLGYAERLDGFQSRIIIIVTFDYLF